MQGADVSQPHAGIRLVWILLARESTDRGQDYFERYSDKLPVESVKFECCDDAKYVGKLGEAAPVPGGKNLPIL